MPIQKPYQYGEQMEDDQDPYARQRPVGAIVEPMQDDAPVQEQAPRPQAYKAPVREKLQDDVQPPAPAETFTQMQEAGKARPPMPPGSAGLPQAPGAIIEPEVAFPPPIVDAPNAIIEPEVAFPPPIGAPGAIIEPVEQFPVLGGEPGAIVEPEVQFPVIDEPGAIVEPPNPTGMVEGGPDNSVDLLSMLLSGAQGEGSELSDATGQAALDQLHNPSPYNADVVKNTYTDLAGGIDSDFDARQRSLDNQFARRGLWGSVGKDFASGRAADTEIGRRDAKTSLASDLARNFATSYGDYNANAINQGANVAGQEDQSARQWLQQLLGYGQQGFENDLSVAQFNDQQNDEYERLLQLMLQAGYGG